MEDKINLTDVLNTGLVYKLQANKRRTPKRMFAHVVLRKCLATSSLPCLPVMFLETLLGVLHNHILNVRMACARSAAAFPQRS